MLIFDCDQVSRFDLRYGNFLLDDQIQGAVFILCMDVLLANLFADIEASLHGTDEALTAKVSEFFSFGNGILFDDGADDKVNNESYSYDTSNKLNDNKIINMFYFPEIGSLLIAYDTGNLDLLEIKTDKVVNMSDIADANINYNKDITNAYYHDGRIYVATVYGMVAFDAKRHHVVDSGIYGREVKAIATAGDYLYIVDKDNQFWAASPIADRHNGNWGFLVDDATGQVSLAPVYDCGSCLLPQADETIMRKVLESEAERDSRIYTFPNSMLKQNGRKIVYHAPKKNLDEIIKILPGCENPTIMELAGNPDHVALHMVSQEAHFWENMEKLKALGCSSILVLPIEKMLK